MVSQINGRRRQRRDRLHLSHDLGGFADERWMMLLWATVSPHICGKRLEGCYQKIKNVQCSSPPLLIRPVSTIKYLWHTELFFLSKCILILITETSDHKKCADGGRSRGRVGSQKGKQEESEKTKSCGPLRWSWSKHIQISPCVTRRAGGEQQHRRGNPPVASRLI